MLRRQRLREKYALIWVVVALSTVVLVVFPGLLTRASDLVGVQVPANLLFFAASMLLLLLSIQFSYEIGRLEDRTRTLAEEVALLTLRIDQLVADDPPRPRRPPRRGRRTGRSAMVKQQPEQQAPPVQRLRVRYAKRGRLRFTSHRDFSRAFERAVFRARVPMAYSSGFNPHPRISYAGAAPTGSASEAEYLELALAQVVVPADVHAMLDEALPPGLDVLEVVESPGGSLSDLLEGSRWRIVLAVDQAVAEDAVTRFLAADEALVERMTKKGMREFDARGAVLALAIVAPVEGDEGRTTLDVVLRHGTPAVRPDDVLRGLATVAGLEAGDASLMTRLEQGPLLESGEVGDPLAPRA